MAPVLSKETKHCEISLGKIPSGSSVVFKESAFFLRNRPGTSLPLPTEVRAKQIPGQHGPVPFESLNVLVKYGKEITIAEGQCLWALRNILPFKVPVPEVYGWCEDNSEIFIYMELIKGVTLENKWESLSVQEKQTLCNQLRSMSSAMRELKQDPNDQFLGQRLVF